MLYMQNLVLLHFHFIANNVHTQQEAHKLQTVLNEINYRGGQKFLLRTITTTYGK